jgi:Beta-lactamase enzyme family
VPAREIGAALAAAATMLGSTLSGPAPPASIAVTASPAETTIGSAVTVAGTGSANVALALEAEPYPFRGFTIVARAQSEPDGSFAFAPLQLDRNTRVRVAPEGAPASSTTTITVDPRVTVHTRSLGAGRTELSLRLTHTAHAGGDTGNVWWYTAPRGSRRFALAATTPAHELSPGVTTASAIVDPPASRFLYRVCLNPSWEAAMGPEASHGPCPHHDFTLPVRARAALEYGGEARGTPRPAFPSARAIASAIAFLDERAGSTSLAVVTSTGHLAGVRTRERFETASVIKVMMLTAYLQMLERRRRGLSASDRALLYPMIHESNNDAASAVLARVGEGAVERVARESGMTAYRPGIGWWAFSQTDAADQARFFGQLSRLIPRRFYGYARYLMSTIEPSQSWGFPPVARPSWQVYFKTGALPSRGLFHEAALLEHDGQSFTVAVLTDGQPSQAYGEQTIEGVARRLLGAQ